MSQKKPLSEDSSIIIVIGYRSSERHGSIFSSSRDFRPQDDAGLAPGPKLHSSHFASVLL